MIHACCMAHARRGFIDAIKVQTKAHATDAKLERAVALMDGLFAIDREAREQDLSLDERHAFAPGARARIARRIACAARCDASLGRDPAAVSGGQGYQLHAEALGGTDTVLNHPVIELSTNWAENSMRPIAIGRKNWLHLGSKEAGPKIAAIFSIVESCRKLGVPIRKYLADTLPGLADRSIHELDGLTPTAYTDKIAK